MQFHNLNIANHRSLTKNSPTVSQRYCGGVFSLNLPEWAQNRSRRLLTFTSGCFSFIYCGNTDMARLTTVRALTRFGYYLNFKVAIVANENHSIHPPICFDCKYYTTPTLFVQLIVVPPLFCTIYGVHNRRITAGNYEEMSHRQSLRNYCKQNMSICR